MKSEVEKFYEWMQNINNAFLSDHEQMTNAFRIVALENENNELKASNEELLEVNFKLTKK